MITILPGEELQVGTAISLELIISTTSRPAFLTGPAVTTIDGNFIEISFDVETGALTTLVETFDLGQLPVGNYSYAIMGTSFGQLCEGSPLPGSFVVVPDQCFGAGSRVRWAFVPLAGATVVRSRVGRHGRHFQLRSFA